MFRSLLCKSGGNLKRETVIINGESSSLSLVAAAKYFLFTLQNPNVLNKVRVSSIFSSFSTFSSHNNNLTAPDSEFVVSYLINSCGLSENQAITASKNLNFKTTSNPDSVLALLKSYGFTDSHISKIINRVPSILSSKPDKTLKPKFDFLISKGLSGLDLIDFITTQPHICRYCLRTRIIPSFDILKSIVQSDQNVVKMINRNHWILNSTDVKKVMVNLELLRNHGISENNLSKYLIRQPRVFTGNTDRFKEIVEKTKEMGFYPSNTTFLIAIHGMASMTEANWRKKMDVYKRWGWPHGQIQSAFRRNPYCMIASEEKIMAIMDILVNEMGYKSLSIAEVPRVLNCSLKERIIPRCSVIRILVSRGLVKENISLSSLATMVDESFLEMFVEKFDKEIPQLMKVFEGQLNYQEILQN